MAAGVRARAALLGILLSLLVSPSAAAQQDTSLTDVFVEVKVERGPDSLFMALARADSVMLLPVTSFLGLLEVHITERLPGRRLSARLGADAIPFGFDTERGRAWRDQSYAPLDARDAVWRDGELYAAVPLLADLLDVELVMQWPDLMVLVARAEQLPVVRRLARERRRAVMLRPRPLEEDIVDVGGRAALLDGMALDWAVTSSTLEPFDNSSVQLGLGTTVVGGGLDVQLVSVQTPQGNTTETFWSWTRAWENRPWLRQARVGDVITGGPRGVPIQGGNVTNSPYMRPADFATQMLLGRLGPGWEVEVYRGEQLIGYSEVGTDGRYGIGVPVIYGQNPVETVAYGPGGEVRRTGQTFVIPFERLPADQVEYNLGVGRCRQLACEAAGNVDLRYGVSDRLTLEFGADVFTRDTLSDLTHAYVIGSVGITRPLSFTAEAVADGLVRARFDMDPSADLHADASYTVFDTTVTQPLIGSRLVAKQADANMFWRPGLMNGDLFFQGAFVWQEGGLRTRRSLRASATTRVMGARALVGWRYDTDRFQGGGTLVATGLDLGADGIVAHGPARNTLLRAALSWDCNGASLGGCSGQVSRWTAGLGRQILRVLRLDAGLRKDVGTDGLGVEISLTAGFPWMRATSRNVVSNTGDFSGSQLFEGSFLWNRRQNRVVAGSGRNLGRAGLVGAVFFDENGDGVQQPGEPGLPDVALRVGTNAVATDSLGRFRAWDLVPFVNAIVEVDTLSLANPLWYPAQGALRVPPSPNAFRFVGVPVREGGEVNGRVEFEGRPVAGVKMLITDGRGRVREATTFTDGTFYIMRLPQGSYEISLPEEVASQLGVRMASDRFVVTQGRMRVDGVVLRLER